LEKNLDTNIKAADGAAQGGDPEANQNDASHGKPKNNLNQN